MRRVGAGTAEAPLAPVGTPHRSAAAGRGRFRAYGAEADVVGGDGGLADCINRLPARWQYVVVHSQFRASCLRCPTTSAAERRLGEASLCIFSLLSIV